MKVYHAVIRYDTDSMAICSAIFSNYEAAAEYLLNAAKCHKTMRAIAEEEWVFKQNHEVVPEPCTSSEYMLEFRDDPSYFATFCVYECEVDSGDASHIL